MRIGVIVEGLGEVEAFRLLLPKIQTANEVICTPLRADLQPKANSNVIARSASSAVKLFRSRKVDLIIVLIDREDHPNLPIFAMEIKNSLAKMYGGSFEVIVKDRQIENWLIADIQALKDSPKRFKITSAFEKAVTPNKADTIKSPHHLLEGICIKKSYNKGLDPKIIMAKQRPEYIAKHSRSFRRLLRIIGEPNYSNQSKEPA